MGGAPRARLQRAFQVPSFRFQVLALALGFEFGICDYEFLLTAVSGYAVFDSCSFSGVALTGGFRGSLHLIRILLAFLVTLS